MNVLDIKEVMKRTRLSRMTIYRLEQRDEFPRRIQLSPNRVGWQDDAIEEWIKRRPPPPHQQKTHPGARSILPTPTISSHYRGSK